MRQPGRILVGVYAWTVTVAFGAVLLDVIYAAQPDGPAQVPAEAADLLLLLAGVTILAGIVAVLVAPDRPAARALLVASLAVVVAGVLVPTVAAGIVAGVEDTLGFRVGPWLRLGVGGLPSILAFAGLWASWGDR